MSNTRDYEPLFSEGMRIRRNVLGDAYVDSAVGSDDPLTQAFQPFMVNYCWGEIWTDDTLPPATRSMLVLAMTGALGRHEEFEIHARGALRNGVSPDELLALLKQLTVYCGVPAGVGAMKILRRMIAEFESSQAQSAGD
ncbi:carboxymuconolactone decarboxylase family protein [Leucobacter sp.]